MILWSTSPNFSFSTSALNDVLLNSSLNFSKTASNSRLNGDFLSFEKNVSIIPSCPFIPPRSKASKNSINFPFVSDSVFPNIASSSFFVVNIVLLKCMLWIHTARLWRTQFLYHMEWYFYFIYAII